MRSAWSAVLDASSDAIVATRASGEIVLLNPAAQKMFGLAPATILGRDAGELLLTPLCDREERARFAGGVSRILAKRSGGELFPVELSVSEIATSDGSVFFATIREVKESEPLRAGHAEREMMFRRIFDANMIGVAVGDTRGNVTQANDAYLAIIGHAREDMPLRWDHLTPPEWQWADERAIEQHLTRGAIDPYEKELIRKDGARVPVLVCGARLEGGTYEAIAFCLDLSEQKRLEAEWRAAEERLRELQSRLHRTTRLSTFGELSAGLAHELNQPLEAIVNFVDGSLLRLDPAMRDHARVVEALGKAKEQAEHAGRIIRSLRNYLRRGQPVLSMVGVNDVVREVAALVQADVRGRQVHLEVLLTDDLPPVRAEHVQIVQVLLNLVLNGLEAMDDTPTGERVLTIETRLCSGGVELDVRDAGCGISAKTERNLFMPFYTTRAEGLGLAISRTIVEAHGGRIWTTPNGERGTAMRFTLPTQPPQEFGETS